jgi:ABC-type branched-subunit amino acid transport system ATPase component/ABC-type branched-subunit amino acid transport system permease subunit
VRIPFKTSYDQDLGLFRDGVQRGWYAALLAGVILLPWAVPAYLGDISLVFIYGVCGVSLMVLAGYTGLVSLGHAAFLGIGAYAHVYFLQDLGLPWVVSVALAAALSAATGVLVGLPALRMTGVYLTIATLAFALIIQEVFTRWERVTHGLKGRPVDKPVIFGVSLASDTAFYFLCLAVLIVTLWLTANVLRAPTGRAWVAIRDSEIAAQSMGVHLARYKTMAFAYSAGLMGAAGALFAHKIGFMAPDIFSVLLSIQFLLMVVVGGLGSLHGALYGAVFVALLPVLISEARDLVPQWVGQAAAVLRERRGDAVPRRRALREAAGAGAGYLRAHPCAFHPLRAAGHLRALAQAPGVLQHVSPLQARHLPSPEDLHALGAAAMTFFAAEELAMSFGGIRAVDGVSFEVQPGEVFTIIGPNGAGKTTIFNLISRIYDPTEGRLRFKDEDITKVPPHEIARRGIARTFQNIELFEHATVLQNLLLGRHAHAERRFAQELLFLPRVRARERAHREAAEKVIDFLDLQAYRDSFVVNLPYGVRKVVEMGRALCTEPSLLLLDEPSSGLSVEETADMAFWIQDIRTLLGITVLMVEHDMSLVSAVSDRVLALNYGRVLACGTAREVQEHPEVIKAYLGG